MTNIIHSNINKILSESVKDFRQSNHDVQLLPNHAPNFLIDWYANQRVSLQRGPQQGYVGNLSMWREECQMHESSEAAPSVSPHQAIIIEESGVRPYERHRSS